MANYRAPNEGLSAWPSIPIFYFTIKEERDEKSENFVAESLNADIFTETGNEV
jgi:hypothetical protein